VQPRNRSTSAADRMTTTTRRGPVDNSQMTTTSRKRPCSSINGNGRNKENGLPPNKQRRDKKQKDDALSKLAELASIQNNGDANDSTTLMKSMTVDHVKQVRKIAVMEHCRSKQQQMEEAGLSCSVKCTQPVKWLDKDEVSYRSQKEYGRNTDSENNPKGRPKDVTMMNEREQQTFAKKLEENFAKARATFQMKSTHTSCVMLPTLSNRTKSIEATFDLNKTFYGTPTEKLEDMQANYDDDLDDEELGDEDLDDEQLCKEKLDEEVKQHDDHDDESIVALPTPEEYNHGISTRERAGAQQKSPPVELIFESDDMMIEDQDLEIAYNEHCQEIGLTSTADDIASNVKRITRKYGWRVFKMIDEDDYHHSAPFASYMMEKLGYYDQYPTREAQIEAWGQVKKKVARSMSHARSSATQAMKHTFLGT
jgi:hypothetical protein